MKITQVMNTAQDAKLVPGNENSHTMAQTIKEENASTVVTARKIEDNVKNGNENNLRIELRNKIIYTWHGDFQLRDIGFDVIVRGKKSGFKYVGEHDSVGTTIYVGDVDGTGKDYQAFLIAQADETKAVVFPIDDLFMISVVPDGKHISVFHNHKPFENKMALLFSNDSPLPFVEDLLESIKDSKLSDYVSGILGHRASANGHFDKSIEPFRRSHPAGAKARARRPPRWPLTVKAR